MSIYVIYKAPIVVEVELDTGDVLSVHLDDEAIEGPLDITADGPELSTEDRKAAARIAESAMWPSWEIGW